MIDTKRTGQRLKTVCEQKGINVKIIQEKLHIGAFQSVYNWFSGKTLPSLDNFYELCKLLGVSMESLIVEKNSVKPRIILYELIDEEKLQSECYERIYYYSKAFKKMA